MPDDGGSRTNRHCPARVIILTLRAFNPFIQIKKTIIVFHINLNFKFIFGLYYPVQIK